MWYASSCNGTAKRIGESSGCTSGTVNTASAALPSSRSPAVTKTMTGAPRAFTSIRLLTVFSYRRSRGASTTTGMSLSISAMGPCFISPAAYPSAWM